MEFKEAVQALEDGRCEGIKRTSWNTPHLKLDNSAATSFRWGDGERAAFNIPDYLADDWILVNEKPQVEEVEVVRWAKFDHNNCHNPWLGSTSNETQALEWAKRNPGCQIIRLVGTYTRTVPGKVKRREEMNIISITKTGIQAEFNRRQDCSSGQLFYEWQEEVKP